ncbi:hypothetical protein [Allokutzneria sp. NRRL B-24872]|uniref:hypothetical protein n=1 Tax=Allokutzneria sp. NRRL B-24872 TaxID=1137961 RepID=UPI000A38FCD8|nr:hypothetical protein [Allokutzneria sp. NRRL B-24872]
MTSLSTRLAVAVPDRPWKLLRMALDEQDLCGHTPEPDGYGEIGRPGSGFGTVDSDREEA